jgi:hypothetical protein
LPIREPMSQPPPDPRRPLPSPPGGEQRLTVSPIQVIASALASVSAAIVASLFNVAGTIVGTVLVSVVATLGAAVYSSSIRRAHVRIRQATSQHPLLRSDQDRRYPPAPGKRAGSAALEGLAGLGAPDSVSGSVRRRPQKRSWRQARVPVLGAAIAALVIAIVTLTIIELVAQKPLSAVVQGQSGSGQTFFGGGDQGTKSPTTTTTTTSTTSVSGNLPSPTTTPTTARTPDTASPSTTTTTTVPPSTTTTTRVSGASGASASPTTTTK